MKKVKVNLDVYAEKIRHELEKKDAAREKVLPLCRELIRYASVTIRAIHRQEFDEAKKLLDEAKKVRVYALLSGKPLPDPDELNVDYAAYLNGLGDTVGELRRYLLDSMRQGDLSKGEELLEAMDDIYTTLVTMDFPDAITGGLRHTTDQVRGILEKTRGDITLAVRQQALESQLKAFQNKA
jgi:translin